MPRRTPYSRTASQKIRRDAGTHLLRWQWIRHHVAKCEVGPKRARQRWTFMRGWDIGSRYPRRVTTASEDRR